MGPKQHEAFNAGARAERRAVRDFIRRQIAKGGARISERDGLEAVMTFLGGRLQRTRKPGGVGRR